MATIQDLRAVLPQLSPRDQDFARNLLVASARYGSLTPKQAPWVDTLVSRARSSAVPAATVSVGDFRPVVALFELASRKLKFPKVRLLCNGLPVILSLAGTQSKAPGTINVAGEGQYPDRAWYGRVTPAGAWEPARNIEPGMLESLTGLLVAFGSDPNATAAAYGRATNSCCFCARELTDARSVAAGYGPVCAEHYGLTAQWESAARTAAQPTSNTESTAEVSR